MSRGVRAIVPDLLPAIVCTHVRAANRDRAQSVRIATGFAAGLRVLAARCGPSTAWDLRTWADQIDSECDILAGLPAVAGAPKPASMPGGTATPIQGRGVDHGGTAPASTPSTPSGAQA